MRQNNFNPTPDEAANAATLKVVLDAIKDMRAKGKAKRKLRLIAIGVDSKSLVWGEFGVCNADDTHRTYLVFDIAGHTRGAMEYVTARELHDALFGGPNAMAVIMHLMCAMHWAGDVETVGEHPRNAGMREANLNVVGHLLAEALPFIQALR